VVGLSLKGGKEQMVGPKVQAHEYAAQINPYVVETITRAFIHSCRGSSDLRISDTSARERESS
jgi:hypothetical protein